MTKIKRKQALALSSQLSVQPGLFGLSGQAVMALETETARIVAKDAEKRLNGGASLHVVIDSGRLSGFVKDAHTTVQFAGGSAAVTTHD